MPKSRRVCAAFDVGYRNFAFFAGAREEGAFVPLASGKVNIAPDASKVTVLRRKHFDALTAFLDSHEGLWEQCDDIVIERQLRRNHKGVLLQQHAFSYFLLRHPCARVLLAPPRAKSSYLPAGTKGRVALKRGAVDAALGLLGDPHSHLLGERKKDDVADCVLMCHGELFKGELVPKNEQKPPS